VVTVEEGAFHEGGHSATCWSAVSKGVGAGDISQSRIRIRLRELREPGSHCGFGSLRATWPLYWMLDIQILT
jgi:hypothetical protein